MLLIKDSLDTIWLAC